MALYKCCIIIIIIYRVALLLLASIGWPKNKANVCIARNRKDAY